MNTPLQKVAQAIIRHDGEDLANAGAEVPYDFARFRSAMLADELFFDTRAIRARWDALIAKGILKPHGRPYTRATMNINELNYAFKFTIPTEASA